MFRFTETVYNRPRFIIESTINVTGMVFLFDNENTLRANKDMVYLRCLGGVEGRVMSETSVPSRSANTLFNAFRVRCSLNMLLISGQTHRMMHDRISMTNTRKMVDNMVRSISTSQCWWC